MANNQISILITAKDEASSKIASFTGELDKSTTAAANSDTMLQRVQKSWYAFAGIAAGAGLALRGVTGEIGNDVKAANDLQSSLIGLSSIARAYNVDQDDAKKAAQSLAKDGLMTVADAATGLKNLLASGFSLPQAIKLMDRFKDSAAFNRQASLSFGDAIRSATEGIKNGNSILVDNAGVTKNLSIMLQEAGFSAQDLMKATTDGSVRQAIYNGIIKETNAQVGDAAKLTETFAGKQAANTAQTEIMRAKLGAALQPVLLDLLTVLTPIVAGIGNWVQAHPKLTEAIVISTTAFLGLVTVLAVIGGTIATITPALALLGPIAIAASGQMVGAFGAVTGAIGAMSASWMVAFPIAGILADIGLVLAAINSVKGAFSAMNAASESAANAQNQRTMAIANMQNLLKNGTPTQQKNARNGLHSLGVPGYAVGTNFARGGLSLVGEQGPELVQLPSGARVTPAAQTQQSVGGSRAVTIQSFNVYNSLDIDAAIRKIGFKLAAA